MIRATHFNLPSFIRFTMAATLMVGFGLASAVQADEHENDMPIVKYRQKVMSVIGGNMGAMADIMKNQLDLPGHVAVHASEIAEMAPLIGPAFKKNAPTDATDAKPEIWQDWAKFETAAGDLETAARNLEVAASGSDPTAVGPAMKALGKSCGGCHKSFRKPKEESFKRKAHHDDDDDHDHDDHE
jgi:cytochrome c556